MQTVDELKTWRGLDLYGAGEEKIGEITELYLDADTGRPEWFAVDTGRDDSMAAFVPVESAVRHDDHVDVPFAKTLVENSPPGDPDDEMTREGERRLYEYYGLTFDEARVREPVVEPRPVAEPKPAVEGEETDRAMTRSEEELVAGTRKEEIGRARLRKYVVTEDVKETVPVAREEVRVERTPVTDANVDEALEGPPLSEDEHEVTLHAEEPVVEKRVVPKERVRLSKDREVDEETVEGEVRKERIDVEGDARER